MQHHIATFHTWMHFPNCRSNHTTRICCRFAGDLLLNERRFVIFTAANCQSFTPPSIHYRLVPFLHSCAYIRIYKTRRGNGVPHDTGTWVRFSRMFRVANFLYSSSVRLTNLVSRPETTRQTLQHSYPISFRFAGEDVYIRHTLRECHATREGNVR